MLQHGAYTLLKDACYDREKFPTEEDAIDWTWASTQEEIDAVIFVLKKFFKLGDDGRYYQKRIAEELERYKINSVLNRIIAIYREAGKANNKKKKEDFIALHSNLKEELKNESLEINHEACTERVDSLLLKHGIAPNHKPLTINQEPLTNTKPSPPANKFTERDIGCARWIFSLIQQLQPTRKAPNFNKWADHIRLMRERDKRTYRQIFAVFTWANNDSFWKTNILSPDKLRDKFDDLELKMMNMPAGTVLTPEQKGSWLDKHLDTSWRKGLPGFEDEE